MTFNLTHPSSRPPADGALHVIAKCQRIPETAGFLFSAKRSGRQQQEWEVASCSEKPQKKTRRKKLLPLVNTGSFYSNWTAFSHQNKNKNNGTECRFFLFFFHIGQHVLILTSFPPSLVKHCSAVGTKVSTRTSRRHQAALIEIAVQPTYWPI